MSLVPKGEGAALKTALDDLGLDGQTFVLTVDEEGVRLD